ncbi:MAG: aminotransferase class III-fold pyridoxal phosphate-dependent enzyme, partial [Gammaproteobacteria bacterium]
YLQQYENQVAAIIIEPLVQGASGMRMCRPEFLQKLEKLMRTHQVLIIYDEVMTGFGRTGDYFACQKSQTSPDIICMAKGITGGFLPLAATICSEEIYHAFLGKDFTKALAHGHSYTANPLGCAAALASLSLLKKSETIQQLKMIERVNQALLSQLDDYLLFEKPRYCGTIAAFNLKLATSYGSQMSLKIREKFTENGLLIRPLGNVIYFLPPYCITEDELRNAYDIVINEIQGVSV